MEELKKRIEAIETKLGILSAILTDILLNTTKRGALSSAFLIFQYDIGDFFEQAVKDVEEARIEYARLTSIYLLKQKREDAGNTSSFDSKGGENVK